jgi:DNA mismatch repair ATPase MutS
MRVDSQTLRDLGLLQSEGYQLSLYDWANFTRTAGGAQLLRARFRQPLSEPDALRSTQEAVRWLFEHADLFEPLLGHGAWLSVERYTASSVATLDYPNALFRWLDSWWVRLRHTDLYREVGAALALVQMLLRHAVRISDVLGGDTLPQLLSTWHTRLVECLEAPALLRLRTGWDVHRLRPPVVLRLDGKLRAQDFAPLHRLAALVYEIDFLCSLARATQAHGLVLPEILEGATPHVEAEGLYHPLVEAAVGNPLHLHSGARLVFLTGPNMAGKSTYLKAAGVAVHLAQLGMGVPARSFQLTPFGCLFSGINTADDLRLGQSYFYREVRRVREAAEILADGTAAFVLFDEMFKGTNLKDASDACLAVLRGFAACQNSAFLVASHLAELATGIEALPGATFLHVGAQIRGDEPAFDYRVRAGVSEQRLGMLILEREGVLERLAALRGTPPPT